MNTPDSDSLEIILSCYLHASSQRANVVPRFAHRLSICEAWSIPQGSRLLDVGCGQGDSSLVLATAVGPLGSVTGIDSAPPDYGGPFTVGQAQNHILSSTLGNRIVFQRSDTTEWLRARYKSLSETSPPASLCSVEAPLEDLNSPVENQQQPSVEFDGAVFCYSMWYFPSTTAVRDLLEALAAAGVPRIYVAEWSGQARSASQEPHALAAAAEKKLYSLRPADYMPRLDEQNIRGGALLPDELVALARQVGWCVTRQGSLPTPLAIRDGYWEAQYLLRGRFTQDVEQAVKGAADREEMMKCREQVASAIEALEANRGNVECMDTVWVVLERN